MVAPALQSMVALWTPAPRLGGAEWADAYRVLGPDESADPGPWRTLGWQRYLLDLMADPTVDWVVVLKAAQMGVSELVRCAIGRWAMLDPGDVLWVMATQDAAEKSMAKLRAMFRNTPALRTLWPTENVKGRKRKDSLKEVRLTNGMRIVIGWATSPSSLASDPFPRVVLDETGLYPVRSGKDGSPIGLAEERTKTFGRRRKVILLSKPAHADDLICTSHSDCIDRRERHVPCPDCGELQPLDFERVRWLDSEGCVQSSASAPTDPAFRRLMAAHVEQTQAAWAECRKCGGRIEDTRSADQDERAAWLRVDDSGGRASRRRGLHISELYHWSKSVADLVARYLRASKPSDLQNFHTGSLGLPYEQSRGSLTKELIEAKAVHRPGVIPAWATCLIASTDTQKDYLMWLVRAWAPGYRSRLVDFGRVEDVDIDGQLAPDFAGLLQCTLERRWPIEGTDRIAGPARLVIDAGGGGDAGALDGSRSQMVYRFAETTPHVTALKGSGEKKGAQQGSPITWTVVRFGSDKERSVEVVQPHANYWKDQTAALIRGDRWEETTQAASDVYVRQMTGQRQVWEETAAGVGKWVWRKRRGRADHLFDCSYMNVVGAELEGAGDLPALREVAAEQQREALAEEYETESWWSGQREDSWWT